MVDRHSTRGSALVAGRPPTGTAWGAVLTVRPPAPPRAATAPPTAGRSPHAAREALRSACRTTLARQLLRFALVGAVMTASYVTLFLLLRGPLGAQAANVIALFVTAVGNTAANRRVTFGVRGRARAMTQHGQGLLIFGVSWVLTSGALALLGAFSPRASAAFDLAVLVAANLCATLVRFVLLRHWVFRAPPAADLASPPTR